MKVPKLKIRRNAQALIAGLIVIMIVFAVGAAVLYHSRSFREVTSLQVGAHQAKILAESGVEVAKSIVANSPCADPSRDATYTVGGGSMHLVMNSGTGTIKSTGTARQSVDTAQDTFTWALPPSGGWFKNYATTGMQTWFSNILRTNDGTGFMILGRHSWFDGFQTTSGAFLTRVDNNGTWLSSRLLLESVNSTVYMFNFLQISANEFILGGWTLNSLLLSPAGENVTILRTNGTGDYSLAKGYHHDSPAPVWSFDMTSIDVERVVDATTPGYILLALITSPAPNRMLLIRTNNNLDSTTSVPAISYPNTWAKTYTGVGLVSVVGGGKHIVRTLDNNGFVVLGNGSAGLVLFRIDKTGALTWAYSYGTGSGYSISAISGGGYIVAGDGFLMRTTETGEISWGYRYSGLGSMNVTFVGVTPTSDGGFIASGYAGFACGASYGLLMKTDANGNLLWARKYASGSDYAFNNAIELTGGVVVATGQLASCGGMSKLLRAVDARLPCSCSGACSCSEYTDLTSVVTRQDAGFSKNNFTITPSANIIDLKKSEGGSSRSRTLNQPTNICIQN